MNVRQYFKVQLQHTRLHEIEFDLELSGAHGLF